MKKTLLAIGLLASMSIFGQDCQSYYFLQNNKNIEMTTYNRKGSEVGKLVYHVTGVQSMGNSLTATVDEEIFDKKGKSTMKATNKIQCDGGMLMMDIKMNMPQSNSPQFNDASATASNVYIEYPSSMKAGDQLKDATMHLDVSTHGMKQSMDMQVVDRKVLDKESVTTPAGTWDCFKITSTVHMTMRTAGIGIPIKMDQTEWFAPGFGIVKSESKSGSTLITAIH